MNDTPLTQDEFAILRVNGYTPAGGGIDDDGRAFIKLKKNGVVFRRTRAEWRAIIAGLDKPPIPPLDAAAAKMTLDAVKEAVNAVQAVFEENIGLKRDLDVERERATKAKREWAELLQDRDRIATLLQQTVREREEKNAAWEAIAGGMADVIRARGEALEPFARFYRASEGVGVRDDFVVLRDPDAVITYSDLRRAAEVLKQGE